MSNLNKITLEQTVEFIVDNRGRTCPTAETGVPLIATNCVTNSHLYPLYEKLRFVDKTTYETWFRSHPKPGDLLFVNKGTPGRVCMVPDPVNFCIAQDMVALRVDKKMIYPKYLFAALRSPLVQARIRNLNTDAVIPHFRKTLFHKLEIPYPNKKGQKYIGDLYFTFSKAIDNNDRRTRILEESAKRLYQEWFVKFRFPGHENVPMVDSELGPIPEGWEMKRLENVSENFDRMRRPLSKAQRSKMQGNYPYYGAAKVLDYVNDYIFDGRYLLMAEDGSVITKAGHPVLQIATGKFWVNNHTHVLLGKNDVSLNYLYLSLLKLPISGYITGAAQPKINQANLNRIPILVADSKSMNIFNGKINPIFKSVYELDKKNQQLRAARDLLLPKLISGQIDVSELDIATEEMVTA